MTDADWARFPNNTNAVESQNKVSHVSTTKFLNVVRNYYTTDKNSIYEFLTAGNSIGIGLSAEKREATNKRQRSRRARSKRSKTTEKLSTEMEDEIEDEETPYLGKTVLVCTKAKRGRKYNWLSASVELKNSEESYMVKYSDGSIALIQDILDKTKVKFQKPLR